MNINFRDITSENFRELASLSVIDDQRNFIESNAYSLSHSIYDGETFKAIYDNDLMIGFVMYSIDESSKNAWIDSYRIDEHLEDKGYFKSALAKILDIFENEFHCLKIGISEHPENTTAKKLYESLGFNFTGKMVENEEVMIKKNIFKQLILI